MAGAYGLRSSAHHGSHVNTGGSAGPLLAVSELISCKEASLIDAYALTWTPTSTSYKFLEIERSRAYASHRPVEGCMVVRAKTAPVPGVSVKLAAKQALAPHMRKRQRYDRVRLDLLSYGLGHALAFGQARAQRPSERLEADPGAATSPREECRARTPASPGSVAA
jgi:hypothetical protein